MSDTVTIITRLHLPDAPVGSVIEVSPERAAKLVNARYAVYASDTYVPPAPEPKPDPVPVVPTIYLPSVSDLKEAWVTAAEELGVATEREDGSAKTKAELITDVTYAIEA